MSNRATPHGKSGIARPHQNGLCTRTDDTVGCPCFLMTARALQSPGLELSWRVVFNPSMDSDMGSLFTHNISKSLQVIARDQNRTGTPISQQRILSPTTRMQNCYKKVCKSLKFRLFAVQKNITICNIFNALWYTAHVFNCLMDSGMVRLKPSLNTGLIQGGSQYLNRTNNGEAADSPRRLRIMRGVINNMIIAKEILSARNKTKRQHKVYLHEAEINMAESLSEKYLGKKSTSLFVWAATVYIQRLLGCRHDYLSKENKLILNNLHRAFSSLK